jgi:hypothetical protein
MRVIEISNVFEIPLPQVVADDTPAVEAVMRADKERWALLEEEQRLLKELDTNPDDAKDARLAEVRRRQADRVKADRG